MERVKTPRYGRIQRNNYTPYGALVGASDELRKAYYTYGYPKDEMMPELPCPPIEDEPSYDIEHEIWRQEIYAIIRDTLDELSPREAKVIRMRFGIELPCDYTLDEIAVYFDVTRERIRQIEAKALRKLKQPNRNLYQLIEAIEC